MKKKIFKEIAILLIAFLSSTGIALADSFSIPVSLIMPAIPGVNAPLIEEEAVKAQSQINNPEKIAAQDKTGEQKENFIQENNELIKTEEGPLFLVKTYYSP